MEKNMKKNVCINIYIYKLNHFIIRQKLTHYKPTILQLMEKAMAPHSSTLAWKIPWVEEPGRLQSMGSQRVGHD